MPRATARGCVDHDHRAAVLEHEVELAEPGDADLVSLGDVGVAPAVDLCAGEAFDVAAEAVPIRYPGVIPAT